MERKQNTSRITKRTNCYKRCTTENAPGKAYSFAHTKKQRNSIVKTDRFAEIFLQICLFLHLRDNRFAKDVNSIIVSETFGNIPCSTINSQGTTVSA